ncbi:VWA domain-containing protein [Candidatus Poribacteria bacterium]|nr:VWA domain-containing protein [Candidatus Poribacteria bacterium]
MQFLNPAAFYLLGVIPIVVALHFLKLRRHPRLVPSIMFWRSTAEDRRANVPFQRLRNLLLPLLQVLFLLLLIFSVARPTLRRPGFMPGKAILIVDNSASMSSKEMGQTRLALAKQEARQYVEAVSSSGGMMLMVTNSADTHIQRAFTTDTSKLHQAIESIAQTQAPRNLRPVFDAATRYADSPQDKIVFISGTFEDLPDISLPVQEIGVGGSAENVGIVRFSVEMFADRYEVLIGIHNFTDTLRELDVQLSVETVPLDDRVVSVPPGETKSVLFSGNPSGLAGKVLSGHLDVADDFPLDDRAWALLSAVPSLRILLVSDNRKSLLPDLLKSYGDHVKLSVVDPADYHGTGDADVAIFDGGTPTGRAGIGDFSEIASGTAVVFIAPGDNLPFVREDTPSVEAERTPVRVIKVDGNHPLMESVSLQGLQVSESMHRALPLWGHSLVETEKGALIWLGSRADARILVFEFDAFNPEISTFALTVPDGPQFIYQCLAWFEAGTAPLQPLASQGSGTRHAFRTGDQVRVALAREGRTLHVQKPDGTTVGLERPIFTGTDQIGVYTLFADDIQLERFTVNLLNPTESALSHSPTTAIADASMDVAGGLQPMAQEVWRWFAFAALLLLLLEWWFYHRNGL